MRQLISFQDQLVCACEEYYHTDKVEYRWNKEVNRHLRSKIKIHQEI